MEHIDKKIQLVALLGSVRPGSYTAKVLHVASLQVNDRSDAAMIVIDPATLSLQVGGRETTEDAVWMQEQIKAADGVILATPEYHGSYSSVIKLMIENMGFPSTLRGKPVSLLGVASGRIGAIKSLEHLRSVASHVGAIVLPGPLSVASVQSKFDDEGQLVDEATNSRIEQLADNLINYITAHICPARNLESFARA